MIAGTPQCPAVSLAAGRAVTTAAMTVDPVSRARPLSPIGVGTNRAFLGMAAAIPFGARAHHLGATPTDPHGCRGSSCPRFTGPADLRGPGCPPAHDHY